LRKGGSKMDRRTFSLFSSLYLLEGRELELSVNMLEMRYPYLIVGSGLMVSPALTEEFNAAYVQQHVRQYFKGHLVVLTGLYPFLFENNPVTGNEIEDNSHWFRVDPLWRVVVAYMQLTKRLSVNEPNLIECLSSTTDVTRDFSLARDEILRMDPRDYRHCKALNRAYMLGRPSIEIGPFTVDEVTGRSWSVPSCMVSFFSYSSAIEYLKDLMLFWPPHRQEKECFMRYLAELGKTQESIQRYGSTDEMRRRTLKIVAKLNELCLQTYETSFTDMCCGSRYFCI
ncbi:MAG: hypothetical protein ACOCXQ_02060, partial [Patescibacteria group bacterium]